MKCIDLFAGAGGFSSGFENAGFEVAAAIEHLPRYATTHQQNHQNSKTIDSDIRELSPSKFARKTGVSSRGDCVIIGGPPCQTFSTIGISKINSVRNGQIKEDPRNYLFKNYFEYIKYYDPPVFVMENVPTIRTRYKGKLFQNILSLAKKLKYEVKATVLNAANYGVPQKRKRFFLVGTKKGIDFEFPEITHYIPGEDEYKEGLLKCTTVYDAISDLPKIKDGCRANLLPYSKNTDLTVYQESLRTEDNMVGNNTCRMSNDRAKKVFSHMKQGDKYMDLPPEVRKILPFREDIFHDRLKRLVLAEPSWTVLAHIGMDGYMYIHPTEDRTLSVREAARIQGFHDSYSFHGNMREQYIQVGNSVPPPLAKAIGEAVKRSLS